MKVVPLGIASGLLLLLVTIAGCDDGGEGADQPPSAKEQQTSEQQPKETAGKTPEQYPVHGKVVAVDRQKPSLTLDHEKIHGLMKGTQMEFPVENARVLKDVQKKDRVQAELVKKGDRFMIIDLRTLPE